MCFQILPSSRYWPEPATRKSKTGHLSNQPAVSKRVSSVSSYSVDNSIAAPRVINYYQ